MFTTDSSLGRSLGKLSTRPLTFFVTLYLVIGLLAWLTWLVLPEPLSDAVGALTNGNGLGEAGRSLSRASAVLPPGHVPLWSIATVAMVSGGTLALPMSWLYTITRQKRGYNQSVVQTLILLPVVVAGVVVLVKYSLALAFSLAGIVAAVRFRNTLEDSKDAVYIFVATSIGLAAGVELSVAATLSVVFNLVTVLLFRSDFGRTPGHFEGEIAQERLERARAVADRSSRFVARLDEEILENMAPAQLEALADRAIQRRRRAGTGETKDDRPRVAGLLTVRTSGELRARDAVELVLRQHAKEFHFMRVQADHDGEILEFYVRLRRSADPESLVAALKAASADGVRHAELPI